MLSRNLQPLSNRPFSKPHQYAISSLTPLNVNGSPARIFCVLMETDSSDATHASRSLVATNKTPGFSTANGSSDGSRRVLVHYWSIQPETPPNASPVSCKLRWRVAGARLAGLSTKGEQIHRRQQQPNNNRLNDNNSRLRF